MLSRTRIASSPYRRKAVRPLAKLGEFSADYSSLPPRLKLGSFSPPGGREHTNKGALANLNILHTSVHFATSNGQLSRAEGRGQRLIHWLTHSTHDTDPVNHLCLASEAATPLYSSHLLLLPHPPLSRHLRSMTASTSAAAASFRSPSSAVPSHLRPPAMRRSASSSSGRSNSSGTPLVHPPPPGRVEAGPLAIDSGDPVMGDILYRLDDEQRAPPKTANDSAADVESQPAQGSSGATPPVDPMHDHLAWLQDRPWYRRPSPLWLIPLTTLLAVGGGTIMSAKVQLFNQIVCEELARDASHNLSMPTDGAGILRFPHERPPVSSACLKNPDVAAASADLQMKITITMGILSAITTGWWGGLSDRRGRTKVLAAAVTGLLTADLSYLAVGLLPVVSLPFGTHFMIISSVIEGLLGGIATIIAGHQGFISDVTPAGTRAKVFAQLSGCFYLGLTVGPALGGWMAKATDSLMSTFVFATSAHTLYILLILFVIPESVSPERKRSAMAEFNRRNAPTEGGDSVKMQVRRRLLTPLQPLAMLLPRQVDEVERLQSRPATPMPSLSNLRRDATATTAATPAPAASSSHISVSHISRKRKRDWNLTWLSISYFLAMSCMGLMTVKTIYAQEVFGWDATTLGLFLTGISVARVVSLTLVLPVIIKVLHRPPKRVALPQDSADERTGLLLDDEGRTAARSQSTRKSYGATSPVVDSTSRTTSPSALTEGETEDEVDDDDNDDVDFDSSQHATVEELWTLRAKHLRLLHDSHFDLKLTRASFLIDSVAYATLCFWRTPTGFIFGSLFVSLGAASSASMASLALALLQRPDEAGRLFGAWSIVSAIGSTVLGPLFFTWVFKTWAHTAPWAIFYAGEGVLLAALACTLFIRVRKIKSLPGLPPRPRARAEQSQR